MNANLKWWSLNNDWCNANNGWWSVKMTWWSLNHYWLNVNQSWLSVNQVVLVFNVSWCRGSNLLIGVIEPGTLVNKLELAGNNAWSNNSPQN
ncbi:hypothetical protein KDU71_12480 [Carboxylicivirga sediminis]|uniref:Uncharacterized protein n=1 Tax=Carboxylicivirga sediminis TaxID=2006564 RepID=A0A941F652_9BACT|nr:hypothetical protein [Carboxylicivirga sediminis]MBR8536380.1 hypothetical protein [Carboxylicivirga sediminis]